MLDVLIAVPSHAEVKRCQARLPLERLNLPEILCLHRVRPPAGRHLCDVSPGLVLFSLGLDQGTPNM